MPADQATTIPPLRDKLRAEVTDPQVAALIIAQIDIDNKCYADALELLLPSIAAKTSSSKMVASLILQLLLGDIYLRTGVQAEAEAAYQQALKLAQDSSDLESQAFALIGLARLNSAAITRTKLANQAVDVWKQLGSALQSQQTAQEFNGSGN